MVNLLPLKEIAFIKREYRLRLGVVGGILSILILITATVLLGSIYFLTSSNGDEARERLAALEAGGAGSVGMNKGSFDQLKRELAILDSTRVEPKLSAILDDILKRKPAGISIDEFRFVRTEGDPPRSTLSIGGIAQRREDILSAKHDIEASELVNTVTTPVSVFTKEKNISFSMDVTFEKEKR